MPFELDVLRLHLALREIANNENQQQQQLKSNSIKWRRDVALRKKRQNKGRRRQ